MSRRGKLIVFTGIDGSGKSTQAQLLTERLRAKGEPAAYVWARWEPQFLKPASRLARLVSGRKRSRAPVVKDRESQDYQELKSTKARILRLPGFKSLWLLLASLDYYLQVRRKISVPLREGKTVVCDRYHSDFLADLALNFGCRGRGLEALSRHWLLKLFPAPDLAFFIEIPPEVGYLRKSDGTSREYLADRLEIYGEIARIAGMRRLDGTLEIEAICRLIDAQLR